MRVVSFFSGIGGFDLGLERSGMEVVAHSEIDPYCCKVLAKHWPDVPNLGDINALDPEKIPPADLWCGGFPCQPFSVAGRQRGADDERHLWPAWFDLIRDVRPRFLLLENVPGLLADPAILGLLGDLASAGYDAEWSVIPAHWFGAPHRRERLWVVCSLADTHSGHTYREPRRGVEYLPGPGGPTSPWSDWRTISLDGGGEDVEISFPDRLPADLCRADDGIPARLDRLRALGNAVVPQVVEWIGRRIMESR